MHLIFYYTLTTSQPYANNKGSDQSAYNRCLICAYDVPCLDRIKRFLDSGLTFCSDFYKGLDLATSDYMVVTSSEGLLWIMGKQLCTSQSAHRRALTCAYGVTLFESIVPFLLHRGSRVLPGSMLSMIGFSFREITNGNESTIL